MNQEQFDELFNPLNAKHEIGQHAVDLFWLIKKVEALNPKKIVEIGVSSGGTLRFWAELATEAVVGVDNLPGVPDLIVERTGWDWRKTGKVAIITADSAEQSTVEKVKALVGSDVDFVYIDGDHTFKGVSKDFENYSKLVRPGGMMGFHDIEPESEPWKFFMSLNGQKIVGCARNCTGVYYVNIGPNTSAPDTLIYEPTPYKEQEPL